MQINLKRSLFIMFLICLFCAIFRRIIITTITTEGVVASLFICFYHWFWLFGYEGLFESYLPIPGSTVNLIALIISGTVSAFFHVGLLITTVNFIAIAWKKLS